MVLPIFKLVALVLGISIVSLLIYLNVHAELKVEPGAYKMLQPSSGRSDPEMKTILLWTQWWTGMVAGQGSGSWMIPTLGFSWEDNAHVGLGDFGCDHESYKCTVTSNRSYLEDVSMFDGLMFHHVDITADLPDQTKRKANQVYIFQTRESPQQVGFNFGPEVNNNFFNVTHSYSSKSGIHHPYGKFVKIRDHPEGADLDNYISNYGKQHKRNLEGMNFSGAIINSNCQSQSNREGVLAELGTMMQVDVFGKCGKPAPIPQDVHSNAGHFGEGYNILGKTHPFLFSFENSLCDDYVSERFFIILDANVIPVVYTGANMSTIAPKHSYIDIKDFADLREVANYLHQVYSDPALYSSYFWWRDFYTLDASTTFSRTFVKIFCEACRYLHAGHEPRVVEDLYKEWAEGSCSNTQYGL